MGTHAGLVLVDNNDPTKSIWYDLNGSYAGIEKRGNGEYFMGAEIKVKVNRNNLNILFSLTTII